jgi:transposase-like protein
MLKEFQDYFASCAREEQDRIIDQLYLLIEKGQFDISSSRQNEKPACIHCKSDSIVAIGKIKSVQRYHCNTCQKNFSETTGTAVMWLKKKHLFKHYLFCMLLGKTLRAASAEVGISLQTSFDWRHKISSSFSMVSPKAFVGIMESDDFFILESQKGNKKLDREPRKRGKKASKRGVSNEQIAVIATCDRSDNTDIQVVATGRITTQNIEEVLENKTENVEVLCTDSHRSYTSYAKKKKLTHKKIKVSKGQRVSEKVYHVQNVNNKISRLRDWMQGFHGVATKYLQNYLNWFMVLEKIKHNNNKVESFTAFALMPTKAWNDWKSLGLDNIFYGT